MSAPKAGTRSEPGPDFGEARSEQQFSAVTRPGRTGPCPKPGTWFEPGPSSCLRRLVVDFEERGHFGQPAAFDERHVGGMRVVRGVRVRAGELHRDAVAVVVLRARLPQDLEL